jgi:hypothetical protein
MHSAILGPLRPKDQTRHCPLGEGHKCQWMQSIEFSKSLIQRMFVFYGPPQQRQNLQLVHVVRLRNNWAQQLGSYCIFEA